MVTAVCSSSPREIENRIEADHPVVSVAVLFSSLIQHCDKTHQHQHADQQMHQIIQSFLYKTERRFGTSHVFPSHLLPLVSLSLSTLRLHDASAGAGLSGGRERGGPAVQDYFSGDSRRCEYEMCFFSRVSCSCVESFNPLLLRPSLSLQDMEITANELKNVLNRVITKRESTSVSPTVSSS